MKIGIVTRSYDQQIGGMENHTQIIAKYLVDKGYKVNVITASLSYLHNKREIKDGKYGEKIVYVANKPNKFLKYTFSYWLGVRREIIENHYDKIVGVSVGSVGYLLGRNSQTSNLITIHHSTYAFERDALLASIEKKASLKAVLGIPYTYIFEFLQGYVYKASKANIAVSSTVRDSLEKKYKKSCSLMTNGVNTETFSYSTPNYKDISFLFLARLHEQKGVKVFLQAIKEIKEKNAASYTVSRFTIAGDGPEMCQPPPLTNTLSRSSNRAA